MKRDLLILYHSFRMEHNRRKVFNKLKRTGMLHTSLYDIDPAYKAASDRYNESKNYLADNGEYVKAYSPAG